MKAFKIGLLIADFPAESIIRVYGDYTRLFTDLLTQAGQSISPSVTISCPSFNCLEQVYPKDKDISTFDAFLITGSKFSAYENIPWINAMKEFIRKLSKQYPTVKLIGICFGHQIIAEALGGKVVKNAKGWEVGYTKVQLNNEGKKCLNTEKEHFYIHEMHQDHVEKLPDGFVNIAFNDVSACQAMVYNKQILSIQAHPEFNSGIVSELIRMRKEKGIFTDSQSTAWLQVVNNPVDGFWFATQIINFILAK